MNLEIANRLVELRRTHGLSQEDLAAKLGVSRQAVSKWERAESSPDTDNLITLAGLYDLSLDELLLGRPAAGREGPGGEEPGGEADAGAEAERQARKRQLQRFPYPLFITLAYLLMGFWLHWWHPGWMLFLTVPLYYWYVSTI